MVDGDGDRVGGGGGDGDVVVDDVDLTAGGDDDDTLCATESNFWICKILFPVMFNLLQASRGPRSHKFVFVRFKSQNIFVNLNRC